MEYADLRVLEAVARHGSMNRAAVELNTVQSNVTARIRALDISGLEVQKRVGTDRPEMPVIFLTGQNDVPMTVQAMKAGATEFLTKPFCNDIVVSAVRQALECSKVVLDRMARIQALRDRYRTLSRREQEVMVLVASGLLNKQVGGELDISEITVKAHRGKVMRKMRARSFADLVNMAVSLRLTGGHLDLAGACAPIPIYWQYVGAAGSAQPWGPVNGSVGESAARLLTNKAK
jgi:FixJ family two-component response regulator